MSHRWEGDDTEAVAFLEERGFSIGPYWTWRRPTPDHDLTVREADAIDYLADEWDWGGVEPRRPSNARALPDPKGGGRE